MGLASKLNAINAQSQVQSSAQSFTPQQPQSETNNAYLMPTPSAPPITFVDNSIQPTTQNYNYVQQPATAPQTTQQYYNNVQHSTSNAIAHSNDYIMWNNHPSTAQNYNYVQQPATPPTTQNYYNNVQQPATATPPPKTKAPGILSSLFGGAKKTNAKVDHTTPGPYYQPVKQRIDAVIASKQLHVFYPTNSPQYINIINRVSHVDFQAIAAKRQIPLELAFDLAALALFDIVVNNDDSGSMLFDEFWRPTTEKVDDLNLILGRIADIGGQFDDDGIFICYFNNGKTFENIISEQDAMDTTKLVNFSGGTPMGRSIYSKILKPLVYDKVQSKVFTKPVVIYTITDGCPDNKDDVKHNILQCQNWLATTSYGRGAVNFMFCQVGRDASAANYLENELDKDPDIGDYVDTTGHYEMESAKYAKKGIDLTPDLWLLQMMLGAVDPTYDEGNN